MTNEESLLLGCLRHNLAPDLFGLPELPERIDWDQLFFFAHRHRALGALLGVEKKQPGFWPAAFSEKITSHRLNYLHHWNPAVLRVQAVLKNLAQANIPVIVLKGWEYIYTVYGGDYSLRPCGDIDLLVRPQDMRSAEKVLETTGIQPLLELWPGFRYRYHNAAYHYQQRIDDQSSIIVGIDLHWRLFNHPNLDRWISIDDIFERAQPLRVGDMDARRLGAEDHVLYAAGHRQFHHTGQSEFYRHYELARVIGRGGDKLNWDVLFARVSQWNLQIALSKSLSEIEQLFPSFLDEKQLTEIRRIKASDEEQQTYPLLMKYRETPLFRVLPWRWSPRAVWESLFYLFEAFVPGPHYLAQRYGKTRFWPLHYLRRAGGAVKQLTSFLRKS